MTASFTLLVLSSKDRGASSPSILYPKEESGSHCLLILDLKPRSAGLKFGSTILFILLSEDDTVFSCGLPDVKLIPVALRGHYDLIKEVISVQKEIGRIEQKIDEKTQACLSLNQDPKTVIPDLISDDIEAVYNKISRIKETGMPTFSNAQKQYFDKNIKDKYNNFEKYFANE